MQANLTNASVSKGGKTKIKRKGKYVIKDNMWEVHQISAYLSAEFSAKTVEETV